MVNLVPETDSAAPKTLVGHPSTSLSNHITTEDIEADEIDQLVQHCKITFTPKSISQR